MPWSTAFSGRVETTEPAACPRFVAPGFLKAVRAVAVDGEERVLKVIQLGKTSPESLQRVSREVDLLLAVDSEHVARDTSDSRATARPSRS